MSTPQDVVDLLEKGNASRRIGATDWVRLRGSARCTQAHRWQNERSSRSHTVFTIVIESRPRDGLGDHDIRLSRLVSHAHLDKTVNNIDAVRT